MNKVQQSYLKSFRRIVRFYNKKKDTIDSVGTIIGDEVIILKSFVEDIDLLAIQAEGQTNEITRSKETIKELLSAYCLQLNHGLWLYVTRVLESSEVAGKVSYSKTQLSATDEMLPVRAKAILAVADVYIPAIPVPTPEDPNPTPPPNPVGIFGATPELVKKLRDTLAIFEQKSPEARDIEKEVKGINEIIVSKFKLAKESVDTLEFMFTAAFLTNNPLLYDGWSRASRPDDPKTMRTRIGGVIKDVTTGLGIRYVKVTDMTTGNFYKTKSEKGGTYSLPVPLGTYTLQFTKNGYQTQQTTITVETEGKKTRLDIMLAQI